MRPVLASLLAHPPSPLQELKDECATASGVRLLMKRDDLLQIGDTNAFCGNKWRKLQYNLLEAEAQQCTALLTFGGAYSNHLAAVAQAGRLFQFKTIGIVRGEMVQPLNATLQFCVHCGMHLHFLSRSAYREKDNPEWLERLRQQFGPFYHIPEGGTNALALRGCAELIPEIRTQMGGILPDFIAVACGTGGTLAGIVQGLGGTAQALGIAVLKGDFLQSAITQQLNAPALNNWQLFTVYHGGGYARFTPELIDFINTFKQEHGIALDPIYTGKLLFGVFDLLKQGFFPRGSTVAVIHTGGLQGITGFNERYPGLLQ